MTLYELFLSVKQDLYVNDKAAPEGTIRHWASGDYIKKNGEWEHLTSENNTEHSPTVTGSRYNKELTDSEKKYVDTRYTNKEIDAIVDQVNPEIVSGDFGYMNNCTRCCATYEALRRGIKGITARPIYAKTEKEVSSDFLASYAENGFAKMYKDPKILKAHSTGKEDILKSMAAWGDGARCSIVIVSYNNMCHNFMAEQVNGETIFINPQDKNRRYYSDAIFDEIDIIPNTTKYFKTNDLEFNDLAEYLCYERKK